MNNLTINKNFNIILKKEDQILLVKTDKDNIVIIDKSGAEQNSNFDFSHWNFYHNFLFTEVGKESIHVNAVVFDTELFEQLEQIEVLFQNFVNAKQFENDLGLITFMKSYSNLFELNDFQIKTKLQGDFGELFLCKLIKEKEDIEITELFHKTENKLFDFYVPNTNIVIEVKTTKSNRNLFKIGYDQLNDKDFEKYYFFVKLIEVNVNSKKDGDLNILQILDMLDVGSGFFLKRKRFWRNLSNKNVLVASTYYRVENYWFSGPNTFDELPILNEYKYIDKTDVTLNLNAVDESKFKELNYKKVIDDWN